jgi:hypothetical protein
VRLNPARKNHRENRRTWHSAGMPRVRISIVFESGARIGPGKAALLESIRDTGSISAAAREMGMSYKRMRTRIKVCCIASADEARLAIKAGADALGFICAGQASTRTIADSTVAAITKMSPPGVSTFLVTNEQTADAIAAHVRRTHPTTVQILSPIDPAESARLAELEPHLRRVQVVHVESRAALEMIPVYGPLRSRFPARLGSTKRGDARAWRNRRLSIVEHPVPRVPIGEEAARIAAESATDFVSPSTACLLAA